VVETISCFLTGGYTEAGYLQHFFELINPKYRYIQRLPNKTVKKKGKEKALCTSYSGLTGEALIDEICHYLESEKIRRDVEQSKAVIIEDDTDDRFAGMSREEVKLYLREVQDRIHRLLSEPIPIIFILACPEIESWFIADWSNGFRSLFLDKKRMSEIEVGNRGLLEHSFHKYVKDELLAGEENPELYSEKNPYMKMSQCICDALHYISIKPEEKIDNASIKTICNIKESRQVYYSKKKDGALMVKRILPEVVAETCRMYFVDGYNELKAL